MLLLEDMGLELCLIYMIEHILPFGEMAMLIRAII